jgi:hypothetical protein
VIDDPRLAALFAHEPAHDARARVEDATSARDGPAARAALLELCLETLQRTVRVTSASSAPFVDDDVCARAAPFVETVPSPETYGAQSWKWDLAFGARVAARCRDLSEGALAESLDVVARGSILAALRNQVEDGPERGLVPHMNFAGGDDEVLWGHPRRSSLTQPPVLAMCARAVDEDFARAIRPALEEELAWWTRARLRDGLPFVVHPWETGRDAARDHDPSLAPLFAATPGSVALETHNPKAPKDPASKRARFALLERLQRDVGEARAIYQLRPPDMAALVARMADDLADLGADTEAVAREVRAAMRAHLWRDDFFYALGRVPDDEEVERASAVVERALLSTSSEGHALARCGSALVALAAGTANGVWPPDVEAALTAALSSDRFWTAHPVPTVATDDPGYEPTVYWRGSVWMPTNVLILDGLSRCTDPRAPELRRELAWRTAALAAEGTREFYAADTGAGYGPEPFTWSGLALVALDYVD